MMQPARLIRIVYALCLGVATFNHVRMVIAHGWLPPELPLPTAVYWSSLTFLDPFAVLMLLVRPRIGIALTVAIIVSDVAHNVWFMAAHSISGSFFNDLADSGAVMSQIAFLFFVTATAPIAWRAFTPDPA